MIDLKLPKHIFYFNLLNIFTFCQESLESFAIVNILLNLTPGNEIF
jgi:hypothetical protein